MSRGYKNYVGMEPYNDGRGYTAHSGSSYSDHVCRPVIVDADGRKHPIIQYASGTEGYGMKAERIDEYRYRPDEALSDRRRYGQLSPVYDRPEKVEDFRTKVRDEASRPVTKVSGPFTSNWRTHPSSAGKDHGTGTKNSADDSNDFQDKQSEAYPKYYKGTNPVINNKDMYFEWLSSNRGPAASSHPMSKPTNDPGSAVDFIAPERYGNLTNQPVPGYAYTGKIDARYAISTMSDNIF